MDPLCCARIISGTFRKKAPNRGESPPISETATMPIAEISVLEINEYIASTQCSWSS
ncbi:hypothetical protein RE6C_02893 [Rhodopirellula europaea 6C]|uniref:Uncharacterized protein n=1 Tax=Rhodopirellula europaea 6C TaxID=1263867 RepID=M2B464_9BACT|nr:hypothetical protein RE6C_02893 [Rhodopirellula europaea 6C]